MKWYEKYIGLPYKELGRDDKGIDCYGLCLKVYELELGVLLPDYYGRGFKNKLPKEVRKRHSEDLSNLIKQEFKNYHGLCEVEIEKRKELDIVLFKVLGQVNHIGIVIDKDKILHSYNGMDCVVENLYPKWVGRIYKVYRDGSKIN